MIRRYRATPSGHTLWRHSDTLAQVGVLMHEYLRTHSGARHRVQYAKELRPTTDVFQRHGGNPRVVTPEPRRETQW